MDMMSGWCRSKRRLDGVTIVVTGCNTGIGKETVKEFYKRGARVIMGCRNTQKANDAKSDIENALKSEKTTGQLVVHELDLSSLKSVRKFASIILETEPGLSVLVNNAGVMMCPESKTEDGFETHMGTNHFGHALLSLLLLPRLRKNAPSRIVFVSSYLHQSFRLDIEDLNYTKRNYDPLRAYSISKAANVLFARALANKLKEHSIDNVTTYSLHPGVIRTEIGRHFSKSYWGATWAFNHLLKWFIKSPQCGAQTSIYCAIDEKCAGESGLYYSDCSPKTSSKQCRNDELAAAFWDKTIEALNIGDYDPFGEEDPKIVNV